MGRNGELQASALAIFIYMYKTIAQFKNNIQKNFIIVGTGSTADYLDLIIRDYQRNNLEYCIVSINRAIALHNCYDFTFIDNSHTLQVILPYLQNTKALCMPIWQNNIFTLNSPVVSSYLEKIHFFAWTYENEQILKDGAYSLNDFLLYISWGNSQSAYHFAKLCAAKSVLFVGCEGGTSEDGRLYARNLLQFYKLRVRRAKKIRNYQDTLQGLKKMKEIINIKSHIIFKEYDWREFISALK